MLIQLNDVTKAYKTPAGDFLALRGLNTGIEKGEFIGILGKSGAGKSTLVNLLTAVDHLTSGEIWVDGTAVHQFSETSDEDRAAQWRGRNLGVIYQSFQLMPSLNLLDNILLAMDFCGQYRGRRSTERAMELLRQVELEEHAYKLPSLISGGQQQRVAIARALANDPMIIVADEPTGRLDTATAETIFQIFEQLVREGRTILMVSHDSSFFSRYSRILWIADGLFTSEPQLAME